MVAAAALGDVVQQHRDVEHPARGDLLEQRGRQRMVVGELAALDPRQQADRADRMLVDRIMMVHVELHLRDDPAEVGNEAAEHAGLVHPAQHQSGLVAARSARRGTRRWRADRRGPGRPAARRGSPRASPSGGSRALRARRARTARSAAPDPRRTSRRSGSTAGRGRAMKPSSCLRPAAEASAGAKRRPLSPICSSSWARNTPVRSPTVFALQEIELHEALDRRFARPVGVMHRVGDLRAGCRRSAAPRRARRRGAGGSAPTRRSARRARTGGYSAAVNRPESTSSAGRSTP